MASFRELRNDAYEEMIEERKSQLERVTRKSRSLKKEVAVLEAEIMFLVINGEKDSQQCKELIRERNNKYREYTSESNENKAIVEQLNEQIYQLQSLIDTEYSPM